MSLPTPLEMSSIGTGLLVLSGLGLWLMPSMIKLELLVAGIGVLLLTSAGVAYGYERMGAEKVQVLWDADKKSRQEHLAEVIVERENATNELEQKAREQRVVSDQRYADLKTRHDALAAKLDAVNVAGVVLDSLRDTVDTANAAMAGLTATTSGATAASAPATGSAVDGWFQVVAQRYTACVQRVADVTAEYDKQRTIN